MSHRTVTGFNALTTQLLVSITVSPTRAAHMLGHRSPAGFRVDILMQRLVEQTASDPLLAQLLYAEVEHILGTPMCTESCIADHANRFQTARFADDGLTMARILWSAAQRNGLAWRDFETRVATDLQYLAYQRLFRIPRQTPQHREARSHGTKRHPSHTGPLLQAVQRTA